MNSIETVTNFIQAIWGDSYYSLNEWHMEDCPKYKESYEELEGIYGKSRSIDFNDIKSQILVDEFKSFFYNSIEIQGLKVVTMVNKILAFYSFKDFLTDKHRNITRLSNLDKEKCIFEYKDWLISQGFKISVSVSKLDKNMEKRAYETPNFRVAFVLDLYEHLYPEVCSLSEKEKDTWDIRRLDIKVEINKSRPRYTINFSPIKQDYLKGLAKKYIYHRLQIRKLSTAFDDLKGIKVLSAFLEDKYPDVETLESIDREFIEALIEYIRASGLVKHTSAQRIGQINTFIENIILMNLDYAPKRNYIMESDFRSKYSPKVEFYSDEELKRINSCMKDMPIEIARMLYVLESIGMRVSELCELEKSDLIRMSEDSYILRYYQFKASGDNSVPISEDVARILLESIESSNEAYGRDCKYIFPISKDKPMAVGSFSYYVNEALYKNQILNDAGKPLRAEAHSFRRTLATRYINMSIEPSVIALMLGQKSLKSLKHYIEVHDDTMIEYLKPILSTQNEMIENIGNKEYFVGRDKGVAMDDNDKLIPLSNGYCGRDIKEGVCDHANACYGCRMFVPDKMHLHSYEKQLTQAIANVSMAQREERTRAEEINTKLVADLEKIIKSVTKEVS